ncbi:MAG: SlyX family protein [Cellvibrionaceae bacterium]
MPNEIQDQLIELETKIQFQDDVIHKLDAELIQQNELIDLLTRRLSLLEEKIKELAVDRESPSTITDEKPPHY